MKHNKGDWVRLNKGDWVRLNNFLDQGPFIIDSVTDTCYYIDFGDGLEVTYEIEVTLDKTRDQYRDERLKQLLENDNTSK